MASFRRNRWSVSTGKCKVVEALTMTTKSSEIAGRIYADLEKSGQPIGRADPIIAAIAIENDLILSTGNERHYKRIQKAGYPLKIVNWKQSQ
ncbi:MAG: hypothetical protein HQM08_28425 [Candidatus Riflebacteria bacterium]|nr:hypothetical protein [Candidatus Riflebacteria bacterium]